MCYSSQLCVKAMLYKYYSNQQWRSQMHCGREREAFYQKPVPASWTTIQFLQFLSRDLNLVNIHGMGKWNFIIHVHAHTHTVCTQTSQWLYEYFSFVDVCFNDLLRQMCCISVCIRQQFLMLFKEGELLLFLFLCKMILPSTAHLKCNMNLV